MGERATAGARIFVNGRRVAVLALLLVMPMGLGACGPDAIGGPATGTAPPPSTIAPVQSGAVKISVRDNEFIDDKVTVTVGSEVMWRNEGRNDHDIVPATDAPFKVDTPDFKPKMEYRHTFSEPGTFSYYCTIHGTATKGMIGTIQVVAT